MRNLCRPDGSCSGNCLQGRSCAGSAFASRAALGLHMQDGGHRVSGEDSIRLHADAPVVTPEQTVSWASLAYLLAAAIGACALVVLAVWPIHFH